MASKARWRNQRRQSSSFIALPHDVLESPKYARLSPRAVKLLLDLFVQYRGNNNGDFSAAWKLMRAKGWRSKDTLYAALGELESSGFIQRVRQGGRHRCSLYAVTWLRIHECGDKLDVAPTKVASGTWRDSHETIETMERMKRYA